MDDLRKTQMQLGIICPIPKEHWDDPDHGRIFVRGALVLLDCLGYYAVLDGQTYQEFETWCSAAACFYERVPDYL